LEASLASVDVPLVTIPHGGYTEFYPAVESAGVEHSVLFFGQVKPTKGLDVLLDAFGVVAGRNPRARLIVAGKPWRESAQRLEQRIRALGIADRVELHLRYIDDAEVPEFFGRAGLVVLPYREIFQSGVLLMCMSMAKATLTSDLPPFVETLGSSGGGKTFVSGSSASLAQELESLLGDAQRLRALGDNALLHVRKHHDWSVIGRRTAEFYASVV
jgi:glycosyltransferase involved in cell wall biosynthesis